MIGQVLVIGTLWWAIARKKDESPKVGDPDYQPPTNITPEGDDYRIDFVQDGVDKDYIWMLEQRQGAVYSDGSGSLTWVQVGYIVGNKEGTGFTSASSSVGGSITFTIGGKTYKNVLVYADLADAIDKTTNPPEDPSGPQKQPDEPKEPVQPSLPVQPDLGLGGNAWGSVSW